jgi:hypothetical protein
MKAKSALFPVLMALSLIACVVASPGRSYAGTPAGTVCFQDSLGDLWFLDFGSFLSGLNFDVHGFLKHSSVFCNGTFVEPISGTATIDGNTNTIVVGVSSIAIGSSADSADCEPIFWHVVIDGFTLQSIEGHFVTQSGFTDSFSLTEIDCSSVLMAASKKSQN